jgi:hypothetical protein
MISKNYKYNKQLRLFPAEMAIIRNEQTSQNFFGCLTGLKKRAIKKGCL